MRFHNESGAEKMSPFSRPWLGLLGLLGLPAWPGPDFGSLEVRRILRMGSLGRRQICRERRRVLANIFSSYYDAERCCLKGIFDAEIR